MTLLTLINELERKRKEATPGPWQYEEFLHSDDNSHMGYWICENKTQDGDDIIALTNMDKDRALSSKPGNAEYITVACNSVPILCQALKEAMSTLQRHSLFEQSYFEDPDKMHCTITLRKLNRLAREFLEKYGITK